MDKISYILDRSFANVPKWQSVLKLKRYRQMAPPKMKRQEVKWNLSHFHGFQKRYLSCLQSKLSVFSEVPSSQRLPGDFYVKAPHLKRHRLRKQLFTIKLIIICQQHSELRNSVFTEENCCQAMVLFRMCLHLHHPSSLGRQL